MKMKKNSLLIWLGIAIIIELALAIACFINPKFALQQFGISYNSETAFLGYIIAWFCLLVTVFLVYAFLLIKKNAIGYAPLLYIISIWWIGLGIGIYFSFGKVDNLLIDSFKGAILLLLTKRYSRNVSE